MSTTLQVAQRAKISDQLVSAIQDTIAELLGAGNSVDSMAMVEELKARLDSATAQGKFARRTGWNVVEGVDFEACVSGKHIVVFKQPNGRSILVFWA